ncbi:type I restriction enzyme endonuclease domain-containing protein [Avibacterium gallinarum]|uniref:type I restriction enzyme endonuclease domain-containing protein n=1 Tax=Avibacterium gallinarum TaxID=755 RepID=UPI003BF77FC1
MAVQKTFEEKLKETLNKYNAHNLTVIEVIKELLKLAKELQDQLSKGQELGLSTAELAFYDALSQNQSAVEILGDEVLLNLAKEITDKLKKSVTIDWQYKENVRAEIRRQLKRALRKYGYPPENKDEAIEFMLKQAEVVADELSKA